MNVRRSSHYESVIWPGLVVDEDRPIPLPRDPLRSQIAGPFSIKYDGGDEGHDTRTRSQLLRQENVNRLRELNGLFGPTKAVRLFDEECKMMAESGRRLL